MIEFTSIAPFVRSLNSQIEQGRILENSKLQILASRPGYLLDLFALGRLLALIHQLKASPLQIECEFVFPTSRRNVIVNRSLNNLRTLGLFDYCSANGITCEFAAKPQLDLPGFLEEPAEAQEGAITSKLYWRCLVPLHAHSFPEVPGGNERQIVAEVNRFVKIFADQLQESLGELRIHPKEIGLELSRILFSVFRELLSNTITHSRRNEFLVAMTISRETDTRFRPHRPGITFLAGQDKYELLVMDFGRGILPSVTSTLDFRPDSKIPESDYFGSTEWNDSHRIVGAKEESLLSNVFRGDLVIRRGRKSEGLFEMAQTLSWFGGMLSLYTGRSELQISAIESEQLDTRVRPARNPHYLPGVIASPILPSHQLKTVLIKNLMAENSSSSGHRPESKACVIHQFTPLPSGFWGGSSVLKIRRRSELDAELILAAYQNEKRNESKDETSGDFVPVFWDVNLKMSENVDVSFIDSLIQELCKKIEKVEGGTSKNFFKLIFTNVPRNVIQALEKRNCKSFLMLKETFCLMLDEADEPHFLGVPRVSRNIFDIQEALGLLLNSGSLTREELLGHKEFGLAEYAADYLQTLLSTNRDSLFYCREIDGEVLFECYDIRSALSRLRYARFADLPSVSVPNDSHTIFRLRNGTYVDRVYDFCLFWSDNDRLVDCTKLLLERSGFPLVETVVSFMHNGDRLASAIQRFTKIPNLIIADPHNPESWNLLSIEEDCILVVDALYTGDDHSGYVTRFIKEVSSSARIKQILAFCDFRENSATAASTQIASANRDLAGIEVISVPIPEAVPLPRTTVPHPEDTIVQNLQARILPRPHPSPSRAKIGKELKARAYEYSPIELSTEFWQNVSALGVIDSKRTGREDRNVLFYENNERLIQNSRMRRIVSDFVSDYVKNMAELKVDVILHPTHPIGSFLAQMVSSQLSQKPLVLPLPQRKYGGRIEISSDDYTYYRQLIAEFMESRQSDSLTSLIVDDSVLTGSSLFTMLGVSERLGLRAKGILVLLSRLSPEVSGALSLLPIDFVYLYRLHMPILTDDQSPDSKLETLNDKILVSSKSYFGHLWAKKLSQEQSHFQLFEEQIDPDTPPSVTPDFVANVEATKIDSHKLNQIIHSLILHPDPTILSFSIRVAIAYNFLEQLVHEDAFWGLLDALFESATAPSIYSQSIQFVQKILYILAFSTYIQPLAIYTLYEAACFRLAKMCFDREDWVALCPLVTDCIMWLGVIGSEKLPELGKFALGAVLKHALQDLSESGAPQKTIRDADPDYVMDLRRAARTIIGAFGWSIQTYSLNKGLDVLENGSAIDLVNTVIANQFSTEENLILIDILEPLLSVSPELREKLEIDEWRNEDVFIERLVADDLGNEMISYLKNAPGYTCTLKTLLRICKADTVLLFVKNELDEEFFLRVFETRDNKRAGDELGTKNLSEDFLPPVVRERMKEGLFFSSSNPDYARLLNDYSKDSQHLWCMGGAVNAKSPESSNMNYYVILGYKKRKPTRNFQSTAYFYWLKCEALLREVLPRIHRRYVESSTEWNALVQAIRPFHPIKWNDPTQSDLVNARRQILSYAMANSDIGNILRRAVQMSSEPVYTLTGIRDQIGKIEKALQINVGSVLEENATLASKSVINLNGWPVTPSEASALSRKQESIFCAFHMAVLEFIAYECLCNALSYYDTKISLGIEFEPKRNSNTIKVIMVIKNDIHASLADGAERLNTTGKVACETAAAAVAGEFRSGKDAQGLWVSVAEIPGYCVPDQLRKQLHDLLI